MLEMYFQKINEVVNEFVRSIDEEYSARMGTEFMCCLDEDVVEWSLIYVETGGEAFYKNFVSRFPLASKLGLFTLSVLHEVGHLETEWEMEDDTDIRNETLTNEEYFNLFNEEIATDWAGEWIEEDFERALALDRKFHKVIFEMYEAVLD